MHDKITAFWLVENSAILMKYSARKWNSAIFVILALWNIKTRCFDFYRSEKWSFVVRLLIIEWINIFPWYKRVATVLNNVLIYFIYK